MRILIDMNLPPRWVDFFANHGLNAVHWSTIGQLNAPDSDVLEWARENDHIVFTHDLDFSVLLSLTREVGPSVTSQLSWTTFHALNWTTHYFALRSFGVQKSS